MRLLSRALIAALAMPVGAQALPPQAAIPAEQALTANGVTARCMARTTTKKDGHDWEFVVPVPPDNEADFQGKGFQPAPCVKLNNKLADHKRMMCELARGNEAVQRQTEAQLGVNARKLCAAAKTLLPDTATDRPSG